MTAYTPPREAVRAAAKVIAENSDEPGWSAVVIARDALTAAGPIIEQEVGERIAREIGRLSDALTDDPDRAALELLIEDAARIAREEAKHG